MALSLSRAWANTAGWAPVRLIRLLSGAAQRNDQWRGLERVMGIEPTLAAWEAAVLPLNYTRAGS